MKNHILILISLLALIFGFLLIAPNLPIINRPLYAPAMAIINNLRQIQAAKSQWAFERGITNEAASVSEADILFYLRGGTNKPLITPVEGEEYVINPLNVSPEARLTKEITSSAWGKLPKGTIIRFGESGAEEIVFPTNQPTR